MARLLVALSLIFVLGAFGTMAQQTKDNAQCLKAKQFIEGMYDVEEYTFLLITAPKQQIDMWGEYPDLAGNLTSPWLWHRYNPQMRMEGLRINERTILTPFFGQVPNDGELSELFNEYLDIQVFEIVQGPAQIETLVAMDIC